MLRPRTSRISALVSPRWAAAQVIYRNGRENPSYPLAALMAGHLDRPSFLDESWVARPLASRDGPIERFLDKRADREVIKELGNIKATLQADRLPHPKPQVAGCVTLRFAESSSCSSSTFTVKAKLNV